MLPRLGIGFGLALAVAAGADWADDPAVAAGREEVRLALASLGKSAPPVELRIEPGLGEEEYVWEAKATALRASTPLGLAYGLFRLAWLTKSLGAYPPPDMRERPALAQRYMFTAGLVPDTADGPPGDPADVARAMDAFGGRLRQALRYGFNGVMFRGFEHYVPSPDAVYGPRSERYRRYLAAAVRLAHAHHLRVVPYAEEALYLPAWLEGAPASVKEPRFWAMLQDKYRRLFRAIPELDGVSPCVGEVIPSFGFRVLNVVHSPETEPDPRMEERYRKFLAAIQQVVAGEFGKRVLPWTWATNDWELHSVPDVYRATFRKGLPMDNLFPVIKLTKQDAWYYGSAFNPTFGAAEHPTVALAELHSQYHGFGTVVDFPARWFAAALEHAWRRGARGMIAVEPRAAPLSPGIVYVFTRLSWHPAADVAAVAREWAGAAFGPAAAAEVAEILLDASEAARRTFYLPPVSLDGWNPLPHIRVHKFLVRGNPLWDAGRGHDEFLRELYLKCKPYFDAVYAEAGQGQERFRRLEARLAAVRDRIQPQAARDALAEMMRHSVAVAALTRDYARLTLSYFSYREQPGTDARRRLETDRQALAASAAAYRGAHRFYQLDGIDQLLELAARMAGGREKAEQTLREAPTEAQLAERFAAAREESRGLLAAHPEARKILTWRGSVDGRDLLRIRGRQIRVQDLAGDGIHAQTPVFHEPIPRSGGGRWLIRELRVRGVVHVAQTPSAANAYELVLYVDDPAPGSDVFEIEVYWLPE